MYFNVHKWKSVVFHSVSSVFKTHPCCYCTSRMLCDMTFWHPMIWSCHIWLLLQGEAPIPDPTMIALLLIHLYIWKFLFNIYPEKSCRTRLFQHLILLDIARMYSRTPIFIYSTTSSAWELHILISLVTFAIIELFGFFFSVLSTCGTYGTQYIMLSGHYSCHSFKPVLPKHEITQLFLYSV